MSLVYPDSNSEWYISTGNSIGGNRGLSQVGIWLMFSRVECKMLWVSWGVWGSIRSVRIVPTGDSP